MTDARSDPALNTLAQRAGILTRWQDVAGQSQSVADDVLRHLLQALGLRCATPAQIKDSLHQLERDQDLWDGDLVVVRRGEVPRLQCCASGLWKLTLESGQVLTGKLEQDGSGWVSLEPVMETGYHRLQLGEWALTLAVVPERCPVVQTSPAEQSRPWGLVAQIYSLHQADHRFPDWMQGGDFSAVGSLAADAARNGVSALALSPAHAMFSADPERYSPYSPSSRLLLNVSYADPVQVLGEGMVSHVLNSWNSADVQSMTRRGRLLDWPRIASLRLRLLRDLFTCFQDRGSTLLKNRLDTFRTNSGATLYDHAVYEALHAHHAPELGPGHGWQDWSAALQDPASPAVAQFAQHHAEDVDFHVFAQWLASESLQHAQNSAQEAGMACGLIGDLAIGTDPRGSHAWSLQNDILTRVSVGAPPDVYQQQGQNWGLTAFSPRGLRRGAYSAFIETLRANIRGSGGIRIDHIAGMERLWLVPDGATAADGAYLTYPKHEMLGLITLEASRHDAIVIGENLGTVSDELNRSLVDQGILGTSVLWFERDEEAFPDPDADGGHETEKQRPLAGVSPYVSSEHWSENAIAMPSTHDLPTIHGWWQGRDLQWQALMQTQTRRESDAAHDERQARRTELWQALQRDAKSPSNDVPDDTPLDDVLAFVARTPAPLVLFSLEDLLGVIDQPNMPGGDVGQRLVNHPNWLQQLPSSSDKVFSQTDVLDRILRIAAARSVS